MRSPPWLQSRLQSLQSLLSRSLSRLLPPCPRRLSPRRRPSPRHPQPPSEEVDPPARPPGSKNRPKPPKTVPAEEAVPAPAPEPAQPPSAPPSAPPAEPSAPAQPAEPVRMTAAQERALRYMQRQDRYMELLARNTHEL